MFTALYISAASMCISSEVASGCSKASIESASSAFLSLDETIEARLKSSLEAV